MHIQYYIIIIKRSCLLCFCKYGTAVLEMLSVVVVLEECWKQLLMTDLQLLQQALQ